MPVHFMFSLRQSKRIIKEYGDELFSWESGRIVGIVYINKHSYDISIEVKVAEAYDIVKVKVTPSCDSPKIGCSHDFKVEVLDYQYK